jgi:hypothetical protein
MSGACNELLYLCVSSQSWWLLVWVLPYSTLCMLHIVDLQAAVKNIITWGTTGECCLLGDCFWSSGNLTWPPTECLFLRECARPLVHPVHFMWVWIICVQFVGLSLRSVHRNFQRSRNCAMGVAGFLLLGTSDRTSISADILAHQAWSAYGLSCGTVLFMGIHNTFKCPCIFYLWL